MKRRQDPADEPPLLPPHGVAPPPSEPQTRPCPGCKASTSLIDLATYGNRCQACYRSFCSAAGGSLQLRIADKRSGGPLAWAETIVERHKAGQSVTPVALTMARDALAGRGAQHAEGE